MAVAVNVCVGVSVLVMVGVWVGVKVNVAVGVCVSVGVAVAVGLMSSKNPQLIWVNTNTRANSHIFFTAYLLFT